MQPQGGPGTSAGMSAWPSAIWVRHQFIGFHKWNAAPLHREYLASRHRHRFEVMACVPVKHDDREVEFHDLLAMVSSACAQFEGDNGALSCEMMAGSIGNRLMTSLSRDTFVTVSEDGECGANVFTTWSGA